MILKLIRKLRTKIYLDFYFKSDYPKIYNHIISKEFISEKEKYIYAQIFYTLYKEKYNLYRNGSNCDYRYDYYGDILIKVNLNLEKNDKNVFKIIADLSFNRFLKSTGYIEITSKKWNKTIKILREDLDDYISDWIDSRLSWEVDYSVLLSFKYKRGKYSEYKSDYEYSEKYKENIKEKKPEDKNFERFKKLVLNLKERKRQIDNMDKSDPNYFTLVNEYNTGVRRWRSMKEKYNF